MFTVEARQALEDAAEARKMAGYYQAIELQWLAEYARTHDTDSVEDSFAHLEVAALSTALHRTILVVLRGGRRGESGLSAGSASLEHVFTVEARQA